MHLNHPAGSLPHPSAGTNGLLASLGLALILVGQPIAWFVRGQFFDSESVIFPAAVVIAGFILLARPCYFREMRAYVHPVLIGSYALVFAFTTAVMSFVEPELLVTDWAYGIFLVTLLFTLMLVPLYDLRHLALMTMLVGTISCILPLYEVATTPIIETVLRIALKGNSNTLIIGMVGGVTMISSIIVLFANNSSRPLMGFLCSIAFASGLGCVILSNTRSVILALIYCTPIFFFWLLPNIEKNGQDVGRQLVARVQKLVFLAALAGAAISAPVAARIVFGPTMIQDMFETAAERFEGVSSLFVEDRYRVIDQSTQGRIDKIRETFEGITVSGQGISAQIREKKDSRELAVYPHFSYLQVFYDLGVVGATIFLLVSAVIPFYIIIKRVSLAKIDSSICFVVVYYLYYHIDHFTHGTPYSWLTMLPIALVYAIVPRVPFLRHSSPRKVDVAPKVAVC